MLFQKGRNLIIHFHHQRPLNNIVKHISEQVPQRLPQIHFPLNDYKGRQFPWEPKTHPQIESFYKIHSDDSTEHPAIPSRAKARDRVA